MFVLHEYGTGDDIDNTDRVSTTGCHLGGRFARIVGIRLKNHLPDLENVKTVQLKLRSFMRINLSEISPIFSHLCLNICRIIIFAMRTYKMHGVKGQWLSCVIRIALDPLGSFIT